MGNNDILIKILFTIILHFLSFNSFCFIQNISHYRSIQLKNGNYLVVSDKGVFIYDRTLKNEMNHIDIEQGPSNYLDYELKHIGEENEGYILLCTMNYFYVFSSFGEFLHKYEIPKNIINTEKNDFYSLITYEYENNNNYFFYSYHPKSNLLIILLNLIIILNTIILLLFQKHIFYLLLKLLIMFLVK